ncbi:MAG: PD40 domain-containing protein [Burkholderiales bacterium]|nr:PD40 domain-containing protein [Anaerolineae bacterium]
MGVFTMYILIFVVLLLTRTIDFQAVYAETVEHIDSCPSLNTSDDAAFSGKIFYSLNQRLSGEQGVWTIDNRLVPEPIEEDIFADTSVILPQENLLAYADFPTPETITVLDNDSFVRLSALADWGFPMSWTLNRQLVINHRSSEESGNGFSFITFDREEFSIQRFTNFPQVLIMSKPNPTTLSFMVSPIGIQVVYDTISNREGQRRRGMALVDIGTKEIIWQTYNNFVDAIDGAMLVAWSPEGSQFAYPRTIPDTLTNWDAFRTEIVLVDHLGQERIATNFTDNGVHRTQWGLSWSPDGNQIAFWLTDEQPSEFSTISSIEGTLNVLNLDQNTVYNLCLRTDDFPALSWSPDSSTLAFADRDAGDILLIDLSLAEISQLNLGTLEVLGWLE